MAEPKAWTRFGVTVVLGLLGGCLLVLSKGPDTRLGNLGRGLALLTFLFAYLWIFRPALRRYSRWLSGTPRSPERQQSVQRAFDGIFVLIVGSSAVVSILRGLL